MSGNDETVTLSAADYAVFGVMLGVSAAVGVFFAYRDRKQKELDNYLLGDRNISPWASGLSASLSFLSGATVIGVPSEVVYFGPVYLWYILGITLATIVASEGFLPVFHGLGLSSANEYYGLRFGKLTRYIATVIYIIQTITYSGVMIYAPALALNAAREKLVDLEKFLTLHQRAIDWSTVFGLGSMWASIACTNQAVVQRFLCCKSISDGKIAMYVSLVFGGVVFVCLVILGFIAYAYFGDCDPVLSGKISAGDQILPYMTLRTFEASPGLSGLFVAGIFAAALSTVSSAINGMSAVTVNDLIVPNISCKESTLLWISRILTLVYGALCIAFAYFSSLLGGLVQAALSLLGLCAGPLLGPVIMGALFTFTNEKGAVCGMLGAFAVNIWVYVGATIYPAPKQFTRPKNISADGCTDLNITANETFTTSRIIMTTVVPSAASELDGGRPEIAEFYAISFTYYALLGVIVCLSVGMIVSCATGGLTSRHRVDPNLISLPFEHPLLRWLPDSFRRFMRPKMGESRDGKSDLNRHNSVAKNHDSEERDDEKTPSNGQVNIAYINDREMISSL